MNELQSIVHIEDDPDILEVARLSLEVLGGFHLRQFTDGASAVAAAADIAPDLFLLDMMMPGLNGLETLERMRTHAHLSHVPAILCTAKTVGLPDGSMAERLGLIGVVRKPFDAVSLPVRLREYWRAAATLPAGFR